MLTMILGEECGRSKPLPYGVDVVLLNKCEKFVRVVRELTAKTDDQWSPLQGYVDKRDAEDVYCVVRRFTKLSVCPVVCRAVRYKYQKACDMPILHRQKPYRQALLLTPFCPKAS